LFFNAKEWRVGKEDGWMSAYRSNDLSTTDNGEKTHRENPIRNL
jgi:hypothetical protein